MEITGAEPMAATSLSASRLVITEIIVLLNEKRIFE
jgi:hypothetical protein